MLPPARPGAKPRPTFWPLLVGLVLGSALQLQQGALWAWSGYAAVLLLSGLAACLAARWDDLPGTGWLRSAALLLGLGGAGLALGFASVGLRAHGFLATRLQPQWEGRDIRVVGVVSAMPQRNETGLRFRLDVESAQGAGAPVALPPALLLGWYNGLNSSFDSGTMLAELQRAPDDVRAAERWQMTVRLKAPHGASNPHGFDYELWLWEQGVQATGYVRAGPADAAPERLAQTWTHPVEGARQSVRDAIYERVPDRQQAGLIAALVVGDQNAIDRW
jgi:competence protein ComEC